MYYSKPFARVIKQIAAENGVDLSVIGSNCKVEVDGFMRLCIEVVGENQVSVAHYFEQNGDLVPDPDMVWWTGMEKLPSPKLQPFVQDHWIPVYMQQAPAVLRIGGLVLSNKEFQVATELDGSGSRVEKYFPKVQKELARFGDQWARNLFSQGFVKDTTSCDGGAALGKSPEQERHDNLFDYLDKVI